MSSRLWKPRERSQSSEKSFPHCVFLDGEDMSQQTDGKTWANSQSSESKNLWKARTQLLRRSFLTIYPPPQPYRHSLPLLQDSFSAELELLLRGRKVLRRKIRKNPIRSRSASNKFKSPNDLPLQTSGAWQHLDDLLREQAERCVLIWKPALKSGGSSQSKKPSFFPLFSFASFFVSLSFSGEADSGDLDLDVNALLKLMESNISPEFCLCLSCNTQPMFHSCCPVLLDLLLASRAVNQVWRQERKVRLSTEGEGTERWVLQPFCSRALVCGMETQRTKPLFCPCRPLGTTPQSFCSHMLYLARFLQFLSLLVLLTAGHFNNLAERGGFVSSCVSMTEGVASCCWEGGNKVWGKTGHWQACFAAKRYRWRTTPQGTTASLDTSAGWCKDPACWAVSHQELVNRQQ